MIPFLIQTMINAGKDSAGARNLRFMDFALLGRA